MRRRGFKRSKMIVAGLTGSIGMGKTTAANMLRSMGYPVHCSDEAVHELYRTGGAAVTPLATLFPEAYDRKSASIDRKKLGEIVWKDPDKKAQVEAIVHPLVRQAQDDFITQCRKQGVKLCFLDIPLLFETGADARVDYTFVVSAPDFVQRQRVLARPGMTEERFAEILTKQMPDKEKQMRADFVIPTGLGMAETRKELQRAVKQILSPRPQNGHKPQGPF